MQDVLVMKMENKILYVNDVLLYITNPDLPTFGTYAEYKVNIQKTQVIMFYYNRNFTWTQRIPTDSSQKVTKYMGVWLPHCRNDLYKENY